MFRELKDQKTLEFQRNEALGLYKNEKLLKEKLERQLKEAKDEMFQKNRADVTIESLQRQLQAANERAEHESKEKGNAQGKIYGYVKKIKDLEQAHDSAQKILFKYADEIKQLRQERDDLQETNKRRTALYEELVDKNDTLRAEVERLKSYHEDNAHGYAEMKRRLETRVQELEKALKEIGNSLDPADGALWLMVKRALDGGKEA